MAVEIERKFLVDHETWLKHKPEEATRLQQGYVYNGKQCTVRVRINGTEGVITLKGATKGISRSEFEYAIPIADAEAMLAEFTENTIVKDRYECHYKNKQWVVDVFYGQNEGLVLAEIELNEEQEEFEKPDWILQEVSDDHRYFNANLIKNPYQSWS